MKTQRVRYITALFVAAVSILAINSDVIAKRITATNLTVVELFTSQGCPSCPPADAFMGELAGQEGILALSWPVDYWDYLGWEDVYAKPAHTERQRAYNDALNRRYVYTPQMVIDGREEVVGSKQDEVNAAITRSRTAAPKVPLTLSHDSKNILVEVPAADVDFATATLWLVRFDYNKKVAIEGGENAGRTIAYRNVVRGAERLGEWSGEKTSFRAPIEAADGTIGDACAILLQRGTTGPIIGAVKLEL